MISLPFEVYIPVVLRFRLLWWWGVIETATRYCPPYSPQVGIVFGKTPHLKGGCILVRVSTLLGDNVRPINGQFQLIK
jgi:hypothetical protein